jgi:hypothetical protein
VPKDHDIAIDRVREYLAGLTSQARGNLLVEIERMQHYDQDIPGADIILAELRAEFRNSGKPGNRIGNPSRFFFKPIEALFVDRAPERTNPGQISRGSLAPIWEWINQVLLPTMARDYCDRMKQVIVTNNPREAEAIAATFQSKVLKCLEGLLASAEGIEDARNGLGKFTSSRAGFDDLTKIMSALRVRDALIAFDGSLPTRIDKFEGDVLVRVRGLLDAFGSHHPDAVPFALTLLARRLETPWQLICLATKMASGKNAEDIAATRYAATVSIVLDHIDDQRIALNHALKANRIPIAKDILGEIYNTEQALRARINRLDKSDWGKRLDGLMATVAADLQKELETLPGNLHHVLGARAMHHGHDAAAGPLGYLARGATYCQNLLGLGSA